jgi:hypothetical protein
MLEERYYELGLDASAPPREWRREPESHAIAHRVRELVDPLIAVVESDYDVPLPDPAEAEQLSRLVIRKPVQDGIKLLRGMLLRVMGEEVVPEEPVWTTEEIPAVDLLTNLFLLKLGPCGLEWEARGSVPRLLEIAALPVPERPLPPVVAEYRYLALEA